MVSYVDDIERICPGLWMAFCNEERVDSRLWEGKLAGTIPCLGREWRKMVFRLIDYYVKTRGLVLYPYSGVRQRLDVVVNPFSIFYYRHTCTPDGESSQRLREQFPVNFCEVWPWSADVICDAFSVAEQIGDETNRIFHLHRKELSGERKKVWRNLGRLASTGDLHDLGSLVFTSMNSPTRQAVLEHPQLQKIMTMIQHIIDADVQNKNALRQILYYIVEERRVLPECLKVTDIARDRTNGDGLMSLDGGFADIYLGAYKGVKVALKTLRGVYIRDKYEQTKFLGLIKEAIIWRQLHHKNVLPFYGIDNTLFEPIGTVTLVSPWIELGDLAKYSNIERKEDIDGLDFMIQIAKGLEYLHSHEPKIIHGDLRGSNILVDVEEEERLRLRIGDFGISRIERLYTNSNSNAAKGAERWMAPELLLPTEGHAGRPTEKTDTYAFAMTCIEIFSGAPPFPNIGTKAATYSVLMNDSRPTRPPALPIAQERGLDDEVWALIEECWLKDPNARLYMRDVRERLLDYVETDDTVSDGTSSVEFEAFPL